MNRQTAIQQVHRTADGVLHVEVSVRRALGASDEKLGFHVRPDNLPSMPGVLPEDYSDTLFAGGSEGEGVAFDVAVSSEGYAGNDHSVLGPYRVRMEEIPTALLRTGRVMRIPIAHPS